MNLEMNLVMTCVNGENLELGTGFTFDYANLVGTGKVTVDDVAQLKAEIGKAQAAIQAMRETGVIRGHLSKDGEPEKVLFSQLPYVKAGNLNSPAVIQKLKDFSADLKGRVDAVISFGIGGSFLGNKVLFDVHCGEFWNSMTKAERDGFPRMYFSGNNIDPRRTNELIATMQRLARIYHKHAGKKFCLMMMVISKSGGTLDTMSNFMVAYEALKDNADMTVEIVAVTDPNEEKKTLLKKLADENHWPTFAVPDGVGGRFSIFSEVGLVTAACIGFDIEAFLDGAKSMDQACQAADVWQNPALLNASLKYIAAKKYGRDMEVLMPYADYLKSTSEWYIQLLAESLGKKFDRNGAVVNYGRTPIVAVGTTDMHAQTQQHQEGALNKVIQFIRVDEWDDDPIIGDMFPSAQKLTDISGITMSQALDVALASNAEALASDNRFNATFTIPKLDAFHLGELLYLLAMSVAYEGELADVDAFDQPGVEAYKRIMGPRLQGLKVK